MSGLPGLGGSPGQWAVGGRSPTGVNPQTFQLGDSLGVRSVLDLGSTRVAGGVAIEEVPRSECRPAPDEGRHS